MVDQDRSGSFPWTVVVVDDHEMVRRGIVNMLTSSTDLQVVGEAATAAEALPLITAQRPDVALIDVVLPDGTGMGLCRQVRARHPEVSCVIVTGHDEGEALFAAVMGGAAGFLTKDSSAELFTDTVRRAARGARLINSATLDDLLALLVQTAADSTRLNLTEQQHLILERVVAGRTDEQIAAELALTERAVSAHLTVIFASTGMERTLQAAKGGGRPWSSTPLSAEPTTAEPLNHRS